MDAYLAAEAVQALRAVRTLSPRTPTWGFLIGHTRGRRFFVERVFPAPRGFRPTLEASDSLDRLFGGRLIGFFAAGAGARAKTSILKPFACGKLFLDIRPAGGGQVLVLAFAIDYDGAFSLTPLELLFEPAPEGD